jgi:hypothetical protein
VSDGPVNLNRFRKAKSRAEKRIRADANTVKFGRSKADRLSEATRRDKTRAMLDGHKLEKDE